MAKKTSKKSAAPVRVCYDMRPPKGQEDYFAALARNEEFTNGIMGLSQAPMPGVVIAERIAAITGKKWANGRTIGIAFLGGTSAQQEFVVKTANEWMKYANLKYQWGVPVAQSDCRIAFVAKKGAYSYIATDNLGIPKTQETMNLGWLDAAVVLHEFGHLNGCIHEHQHPLGGIPWNKPVVNKALGGPPNNWDAATIQSNMYDAYAISQTQFSAYDKKSIMHYAIDKTWVLDPAFAVGWNNVLSGSDMSQMGIFYPGAAGPVDPPVVVPGKISATVFMGDGTQRKLAEVPTS